MKTSSLKVRSARLAARFRRAEGGQALVEFALIMPFLLLLLVGIVEFGRGWNLHQVVTDAAREGARKAVIYDNTNTITVDSITNTMKAALASAGVDTSRADIIIDPGAWNAPSGQPTTVSITLPYRLIFFGALKQWTTGQSTVSLRSSFTMRNE